MPLLVSIHAPWEGCDQHLFYCEDRTDSFNSRTLGRVRPLSSVTFICASMFQFTHPGKGATSSSIRQRSIFLWFQFPHPGKGATVHLIKPNTYIDVSIHAPWEGCDCQYFLGVSPAFSFNSRTLGRVRLASICRVISLSRVSIHAPWEGCDSSLRSNSRQSRGFNSRTLGRVRLFSIQNTTIIERVSIHAPWEGCDSD